MDPTARLIDASANRAREGLRVMEDIARFALNDADLTERLKRLRHDLRAQLAALPIRPGDLLAARDTAGDVGTTIATSAELDRAEGLADLGAAAAKRVQEALRTLEEASKSLGRDGKGFEAARYAAYGLERALSLRLAPPCPQWSLCVLVTRAMCVHHKPEEVVRRAAAGGAGCIQVREKNLPDAEHLDHAAGLVVLAHQLGLHAVVNDRTDIARLAGADGVHLGQTDLPVAAARAVLGPARWVGVSCATIEHARQAAADGADYCGLGPMFPSTTRPNPALAGTELVRAFLAGAATAGLPHLAISGVTPASIGRLASAGCRGVAACGAVCAASDPKAVCEALVRAVRPGADATIRP